MEQEIASRLDRMERTLSALVAALAPEESEASTAGFDDLVAAVTDLAVAVDAQSRLIMRLSTGSGGSLPDGAHSSPAELAPA